MKSSTDSTVPESIAAGQGFGARSGGTSLRSLRNRVHLAVTPQVGSSAGVARAPLPPQRPAADRQVAASRPDPAGVAVSPVAADPALRRTVQAVPNQLR